MSVWATLSIEGPRIALVLMLIVLLKMFYPWFAGKMGESKVQAVLSKLDRERYTALHDVMIETEPGQTAQIDHVVFSPYGIFVIETKNYEGWIYGRESESAWTQKFPRTSHRFQNPIRQNQGHIRKLSAVLGIPPDGFHSIIAFGRQATLKVDTITPVLYMDQILRHIRQYQTVLFSPGQIVQWSQTLKNANVTSKTKRRQHVNRIRQRARTR